MTHRFTNCTFDLRGVDYACVSRGDEFEIGHIGEGDRVLIDGDTLDFTGLHILGPVALAERIKVAVELECQFLTTERGSLRTEIDTLRDELAKEKAIVARLTAELHEVKADLAWLQNNRDRWQDSATQRHFRAEKAEAERDAFRRNLRETFDAMCAMRDSINEYLPIPSLESDLLQGPENSIFCATVAEAVGSALIGAQSGRDATLAGARKAHDALWELNPNNYDHDEVCKLNDGAIEAILTLAPLIGETHGYSPEWWNQRAALQPDLDARQADLAKAWMMGREDAAGAAKHAGLAFGYERAVQAIRALTPPADMAAKIGGE